MDLEEHSVSFHYNILHTYLNQETDFRLVPHKAFLYESLWSVPLSLKYKNHVLMDLVFALFWMYLFEKEKMFWSQTTNLFKFDLKLRISFSVQINLWNSLCNKYVECSKAFSLQQAKVFFKELQSIFAFCDVILSVEAIFLLRIECNGLVKYGHNVEDFMCSLCSSCYFNLFSKYLL